MSDHPPPVVNCHNQHSLTLVPAVVKVSELMHPATEEGNDDGPKLLPLCGPCFRQCTDDLMERARLRPDERLPMLITTFIRQPRDGDLIHVEQPLHDRQAIPEGENP